jgi:hypothetical protein
LRALVGGTLQNPAGFVSHKDVTVMADSEKVRQVKTKDKGPVEKTKKLPAAFPDKDQKDKPGDQKQGSGARLHGSM